MAESQATEPLYLIDASIYIFRAYYSIPDTFVNGEGESVNAVYGYTGFLLDLLEKSPRFISCAFDESLTTCFRNNIYPAYKANRDLPNENLTFQLACCQEITSLMGIHSLCLNDYEADDIIGMLQARLGQDRPVIIVTRDKDLGQLLRDEDRLWDFAADDFAGPREVKEKFGVLPHQIADYLALAGDAVDNIPGAPGIGAKTAAALLSHFGSIDEIYSRLNEITTIGLRGAAKISATLVDHEEKIRLFRQITAIECKIDVAVSLDELVLNPAPWDQIEAFCERMSFGQRVRERLAAAVRQ